MDKAEIIKKIENAIALDTELPDLEFKSSEMDVPARIWRSISAFANSKNGGLIVFGVRDHPREVIGCSKLDLLQTKLNEFFGQKMSHPIKPEYFIICLPATPTKTLLAVYVPECPIDYQPYYFKSVGLPAGAYIREANTSRAITDNELRSMVAKSKRFQFDATEAQNAELSDLDFDKVKALLEKSEEQINRGANPSVSQEMLINLRLAKEIQGKIYPTLAGYLIFSKIDPQNNGIYERYTVRCVCYSGSKPSSEILDKSDITGTLDKQIDEVYKFILKNIKKKARIIGTKRLEQFEYPEKAIRELVANAIIHRDYTISETYTRVSVFFDRVEISNPGNLPPGVTVENIKDAQFSRNTIIASRLKDLDYLEEYGRGIDIVYQQMEEWGLISPLFRNISNSFDVVLFGEKYKDLNTRQIRMLNLLLLKEKADIKDFMKILKGTPRPTINSDLKKLKKTGFIEQRGASSAIYYIISL